MGSWNEVCALSRVSISPGDRIVMLILKETNDGNTLPSIAACPPIRGNYDDYGRIEWDVDDPVVPFLEKFFKCDFEGVHEEFTRWKYEGKNEQLSLIHTLGLKYCFILEEVYEYLCKPQGSLFDRHNIGSHEFLTQMGFKYLREDEKEDRYKKVYGFEGTDVELHSDGTYLNGAIYSFENMFKVYPQLKEKIDISKLSKDKFDLATSTEDWASIMSLINSYHRTLGREEAHWFRFISIKNKMNDEEIDMFIKSREPDVNYLKRVGFLEMFDRFDENPIPELDEKVAKVKAIRTSKENFQDWWVTYCDAERELTNSTDRGSDEHNYVHYKLHCNPLWIRVYYEMLQNQNMYFVKEMFKLSRLYRACWLINMPIYPLEDRVGTQCGEYKIHNDFLKMVVGINDAKLKEYDDYWKDEEETNESFN
jgi:hypothetical protein